MSPEARKTALALFLLVIPLSSSGTRSQDDRREPTYRVMSPDGTTSFPFEWYRDHILLKVEVNGKELRLTLDNGVLWDSLLLYGGPRIDALNLEYDRESRLGQPGDPNAISADMVSGITIRLPGVELKNQTAVVTPASSNFSKIFQGEDGVISGCLFSHFVVRIDFDNMVITLTEPGKFEYRGKGQALTPKPFGRGAYTLPCTLHMQDGTRVVVNPMLDLGGLQPMLLFLGKRKDIPVPDDAIPAQLGVAWTGSIGRVRELQIGRYTLKDVVTGFTETEGKLGPDCEGLLGPQVFARFTTTFDYRNSTLYLEPNKRFHDEFKLPSVGLRPVKKGG